MTLDHKKISIALAVSVGLNLFLAGVLVARAGRPGRPHDARPPIAALPAPGGPEARGPHAAPPRDDGPDARERRRGDRSERRGREFTGEERGPGPEAPQLLREMIRTLGGADDPRVQKVWGERRAEMEKFRESMTASRGKVQAALAAEPFDEKALDQALQDTDRLADDMQARSRASLVALAKTLTPEERQRLSTGPGKGHRLEHEGPRGPRAPRDDH